MNAFEKDAELRESSADELRSPYLEAENFQQSHQADDESKVLDLALESPFSNAERPITHDVEQSSHHPVSRENWSEYESYEEDVLLEDEVKARNNLPRMKFEFQTTNRIFRNDGKTPASLLGRKYGPDDFLVDFGDVRLESETNGVLEFETEWIRDWSKLRDVIAKAVAVTSAINNASPARHDSKRSAFPFKIDHLRTGTSRERGRGYWDRKKGKEGSREKILSKDEELEVEIVDRLWKAGIQSSETFMLAQYESYLKQHEWDYYRNGAIKHATEVLKKANSGGIPDTELVNLRNFLLIIVNYIMRGQGGRQSEINGAFSSVRGTAAKQAFTLMSRTNFASMYSSLLTADEREIFRKIVRNDILLDELGMNRKTRVFIDGYGSDNHQVGPTIYQWISAIYNNKDLLTARHGAGLSAAMGRYTVATRKGEKSKWQIRFETRNTRMGAVGIPASDWIDYARRLYEPARERRRLPVARLLAPMGTKASQYLDYMGNAQFQEAISVATAAGIRDENELTNLLFHTLNLQLGGRRIRKNERSLARHWLEIRKDVVRPALKLAGSHETYESLTTRTPDQANSNHDHRDSSNGSNSRNTDWPGESNHQNQEQKLLQEMIGADYAQEGFNDNEETGLVENIEGGEESFDLSDKEWIDELQETNERSRMQEFKAFDEMNETGYREDHESIAYPDAVETMEVSETFEDWEDSAEPENADSVHDVDDLETLYETDDSLNTTDVEDKESLENTESRSLDPDLLHMVERIFRNESPIIEHQATLRRNTCFSPKDISNLANVYQENDAAARSSKDDRCSCIVMLNVALGQLLQLKLIVRRARNSAMRKVKMGNLSTESIETAMRQLRRRGYTVAPTIIDFYDSRARTAGTLKPVRLKSSVQERVLTLSHPVGCWYAIGLSVVDGYHSVLLLVDRTSDEAKIYWLDQHSTGVNDDVTTTLDERLTNKTLTIWQSVMDKKGKGFNTTIRLWLLNKV